MTDSIQGAAQDRFDEWVLPPLHDCYYLTGATASGKTPLALEIATRLDAEIISLDSMAIYRGMDIGTAKPSLEERKRIPHHLIDIVDPIESYSVSSYVMAAHEAAAEIRGRGKKVLICGGTPLYLKSLIRGLFLGPEADWEFRESVESDIQAYGEEALLARLKQVDPLLSHKLHPHDHRRIIRALEVAKVTGSPLSHWQQQFDKPAPKNRCPVAVLKIDRAWLHTRINTRVDQMLEQGLVGDVEQLQSLHGQLGRTALQAVGYREVIEHQSGKLDAKEMVEAIKAHTRQFARRQEIWFRGLRELEWCEVSPEKTADSTVNEIIEFFHSSHR
ncbi:MAG: tRNA (adenosine(37)-N6)-dimethylallyltransferase MiaA [Planctomycetota bacterium]